MKHKISYLCDDNRKNWKQFNAETRRRGDTEKKKAEKQFFFLPPRPCVFASPRFIVYARHKSMMGVE